MIEQNLIAAFMADRRAFETFERLGNADNFSPLGKRVLESVSEYYKLDDKASSVSRSTLRERELARLTNDKHRKPLEEYFEGLPRDISSPNVEHDIRELHKRAVGGKLSLALANGADDSEVMRLIEEYRQGGASPEGNNAERLVDVFDTSDLTIEGKSNVEYIRLWPKALNDRLEGGVLRGHHVLLFARPETGKTTFCGNLTAGFLNQKLRVLYVGNEEPLADIRDRIRARLLGTSKASVRGSPGESAARLAQLHLGEIYITEGTTFANVRACLGARSGTERRFDVVILDQVRNMRLKSDSRTTELEAAGIEARSIAKEFNVLVVSVTQAGDSASNRVYLTMSDVDSSKTGLPASADLMIGLGCDQVMKANGLLGISLPKNKISGDHSDFTVSVNFQTGVIT